MPLHCNEDVLHIFQSFAKFIKNAVASVKARNNLQDLFFSKSLGHISFFQSSFFNLNYFFFLFLFLFLPSFLFFFLLMTLKHSYLDQIKFSLDEQYLETELVEQYLEIGWCILFLRLFFI